MINFLAFQVCWFACVLGAAWGMPWVGTTLVGGALCWHLAQCGAPAREAALLLVVTLLGTTLDSILLSLGWVEFDGGLVRSGIAPHWMMALWAIFATTLNASLSWLRRSPWLAALCGAVGGPLSYLAGERLGALTLVNSADALPVLALGWALLTPLLSWLGHRLGGYLPSRQRQGGGVA